MTKQELRKLYKEKRLRLSTIEQSKYDDLMLIQLQRAAIPFATTLLSFWPMEQFKEPNTHLFTDYLAFINPALQVAYPIANFISGEMEAIITDAETSFEKKENGIFEPVGDTILAAKEIDIVFVPLLIVDTKGYRVGYGKGFYDKYLTNCNNDCLKIGFSYFEPIKEIADTNQFDVPLDYCITPQAVYVF